MPAAPLTVQRAVGRDFGGRMVWLRIPDETDSPFLSNSSSAGLGNAPSRIAIGCAVLACRTGNVVHHAVS